MIDTDFNDINSWVIITLIANYFALAGGSNVAILNGEDQLPLYLSLVSWFWNAFLIYIFFFLSTFIIKPSIKSRSFKKLLASIDVNHVEIKNSTSCIKAI